MNHIKVSKGPKKLTKSPDSCGISMFISEDLAVTMSALIESLLRYTIHPSVLSIDTVGTFPKTCKKYPNDYKQNSVLSCQNNYYLYNTEEFT